MRSVWTACVVFLLVGAPSFADEPPYGRRLVEHIARFKQYPLAASALQIEGTAVVRFALSRDGKLLNDQIMTSSGDADLDTDTLAMLQRAQPFPPLPDELKGEQLQFTLPVKQDNDVELAAYMPGDCAVLKLAGQDFRCSYVVYALNKQGRANFTVRPYESTSAIRAIAFSGTSSQKPQQGIYELTLDRIETRVRDGKTPDANLVPVVTATTGACRMLGDFRGRHISKVSCHAAGDGREHHAVEFDAASAHIKVRSRGDDPPPGSP